MKFNQAQIEQKYNALPENLKELLDSVEIGELVQTICENNGLEPEEIVQVMNQTTYVILGLTKPTQFANTLINDLQIEKKATIAISEEIEKKVFSKMYTKTESVTPAQPQPTPPPAPPIQTPPPMQTPPPQPKPVTPPPAPTVPPPPTPTPTPPPAKPPTVIEQQIQDAINSGIVYEALEKIGGKYNLHLDQIGDLNKQTEKVLLGQLLPELFIKTIISELEITAETAKKITVDINSDVITKVRKNLQKIQTEVVEPKQTPTPPPVTPAPPRIIEKTIYKEENKPLNSSGTNISDLEKAGDFTIEKSNQAFSSLHNLPDYSSPSLKVDEIEEKMPITDVSHLIQDHVSPPPPKPTPPPTPRPAAKPYTSDPYREPV